jgi:hypothetical protein
MPVRAKAITSAPADYLIQALDVYCIIIMIQTHLTSELLSPQLRMTQKETFIY